MAPPTDAPAGSRKLILLAGASGSGKSRLARLAGCPQVSLDDFYRDGDDADLPHTLGIVDWDDIGSWDVAGAVAALTKLSREGVADVPVYSIMKNRRTGVRTVRLEAATTFVAEGVFAPDVVPLCRAAGLSVEALYLDRPRIVTLVLRFARDLRERLKPPWVLVRRGLALWRAEPRIRRHAVACGCRPVGLHTALAAVRS